MTIVVLGIDLGKRVCSVAGLDDRGRVVRRRRLRRDRVFGYTAQLEPCIIAMEACCGAHFLARGFEAQGHEVRLMSPEYVRPYVKSHKNDDRDAEATAEAATRGTMRFVQPKSERQLDIQSLHRVRERLVGDRTALINQMRAILFERGIAVAQGKHKLVKALPEILADEANGLSPRVRVLLQDLRLEWRALDQRIGELDREFLKLAREDPAMQRLLEIPGIGPLIATALVAAIGDGSGLHRGRALAAWLGLVPRQHTTGGNPKLLRISKRGNAYLRTLLIHGARAVLPHLIKQETPLGRWLRALMERSKKYNTVVVALASKIARMAWAVLAHGTRWNPAGIAA